MRRDHHARFLEIVARVTAQVEAEHQLMKKMDRTRRRTSGEFLDTGDQLDASLMDPGPVKKRRSQLMAKMVFAIALVLLVTGPVWAWSAGYSWTPVAGATGYRVHRSVDSGTTWIEVGSVTAATYTYTGSETGLTIFRVSACNAQGCTTRLADGWWHNEAWQPPLQPTGLTVQ